jgi:hypothetical protein
VVETWKLEDVKADDTEPETSSRLGEKRGVKQDRCRNELLHWQRDGSLPSNLQDYYIGSQGTVSLKNESAFSIFAIERKDLMPM